MDVSAEAVGIDVHEEVRANLEQMTNDIVERLIRDDVTRRPLKVSIDSDFKPILYEHYGRGPRVSSGGLDVIALAMRLALMRLVKEKHNPDRGSIGGVLILDEPFGNVDPQRRGRLLKLLKTGEWRVSQVVEISSWHRDGGSTGGARARGRFAGTHRLQRARGRKGLHGALGRWQLDGDRELTGRWGRPPKTRGSRCRHFHPSPHSDDADHQFRHADHRFRRIPITLEESGGP